MIIVCSIHSSNIKSITNTTNSEMLDIKTINNAFTESSQNQQNPNNHHQANLLFNLGVLAEMYNNFKSMQEAKEVIKTHFPYKILNGFKSIFHNKGLLNIIDQDKDSTSEVAAIFAIGLVFSIIFSFYISLTFFFWFFIFSILFFIAYYLTGSQKAQSISFLFQVIAMSIIPDLMYILFKLFIIFYLVCKTTKINTFEKRIFSIFSLFIVFIMCLPIIIQVFLILGAFFIAKKALQHDNLYKNMYNYAANLYNN